MFPWNNQFALWQALVKKGSSSSGRPSMFVIDVVTQGHGLAFVDYGDFWKTQRKFGLMTLRG